MKFNQLPISLRAYLAGHVLPVAVLGYVVLQQPHPQSPLVMGLLLLSSLIFSTWKVHLTVLQGQMTPTFAVVCLAQLLEGGQAALVCAVVGAVAGSLIRPVEGSPWRVTRLNQPAYRLFFNAANVAISCAISSLMFALVEMSGPRRAFAVVFGLVAFTGTYFLINTVGVSLAIAFQQRLRWLTVWQQNFVWTAPGFFASASAAAGIHAIFLFLGPWSLLFLPPLYLIHYSYRLYMDRLHLFSAKVQQDLAHIQELNQLNQAVIASLATAIDAKDRYTSSHINRVQTYAIHLARAAGVDGPNFEAIVTGSLVHDIGKLGIPDHILSKPGKLTAEEFRRIQSHVTIGAEILSPVPFPFPVVDIVMTHHERWDGNGYPNGLRGEDIPIGGRIISVVDVFDALTSNRPYRRAMTHEMAMQTLRESAGKQFDPSLVTLFEQALPAAHEEIERMEAAAAEHSEAGRPLMDGKSALAQISQAAAEMAAVCEVAHSLAEQKTPEGTLSTVVDRALSLLPADTAVFYLCEGSGLRAAAVRGKYDDKLRDMSIQVGEGVSGCVAGDQRPRVNVSASLDVARRFTPEEAMELSAATAVPVVHGPEVLGVLAVYTQGYSVRSEHHLHVLNIIAEHAAAAIQNNRRMERNEELAYTDPLTGLANSRCLVRRLDRLVHYDRSDRPFGVVMLDLDRFKDVNDTLGHLRGDDLLRQVAVTLQEIARPEDTVCRYAGDEFVLLLPGMDSRQADSIAARVRSAVDGIPAVDGQVKIGASVGVSLFPADGREGRELIQAADQRMYEDKYQRRQGKGERYDLAALVVAMPPTSETRKPVLARSGRYGKRS